MSGLNRLKIKHPAGIQELCAGLVSDAYDLTGIHYPDSHLSDTQRLSINLCNSALAKPLVEHHMRFDFDDVVKGINMFTNLV